MHGSRVDLKYGAKVMKREKVEGLRCEGFFNFRTAIITKCQHQIEIVISVMTIPHIYRFVYDLPLAGVAVFTSA